MKKYSIYFFIIFITYNILAYSQQIDSICSLPNIISETSGLVYINDKLLTHNDSGGEPALYEIDTANGEIIRKITILNAENTDWEDICKDSNFIYIADIGNNSCIRTDLKIYKVVIDSVLQKDSVNADIINFSYADQTDFTPNQYHTNYDAEALIAYNDSLYIFTKNWGNKWTNIYSLPKQPGNYSIEKKDSINAQGLITGATLNNDKIVLTGYTFTYPFIIEIKNFEGKNFSEGEIIRNAIQIPSSFTFQIEAIAPIDTNNYFVTTEGNSDSPAGLFYLKFSYPTPSEHILNQTITIYPNPTHKTVNINCKSFSQATLTNITGNKQIEINKKTFETINLENGIYVLTVYDKSGKMCKQEKITILH